MKKFAELMQWVFARLWGFIPRKLPVTGAEHEAAFQYLKTYYAVPEGPGYRQAFATFIMHLKPTVFRASPNYFAQCLHKARANEAAFMAIEALKAEQKKMAEAVVKTLKPVETKTGEDTPQPVESSDGKAIS